jgi:hypothetical protein
VFLRRSINRDFRSVEVDENGPHTPFLHGFSRTVKKSHSLLLAQAKPRNMINDMNDKNRYVKVWAALMNISSNISHQEHLLLRSLKTGFPSLQ